MIDLAPDENVFYPMPYVEGEAHLLVITNLRVVHFGEAGKQELPAKQVQFVGRLSLRPVLTLGVILALLTLPGLGFGIYWMVTSGLFTRAPAVTAGDDPSVAQPDNGNTDSINEDEPPPPPPDTGTYKVLGSVFTATAIVFAVVGLLLIRVRRHYVIVRGTQQVVQIRAKTPMEQTQILATLGALASSQKAMPQAPAAPQVQVDDKGDPVKALQELAQARALGNVSEEEFEARREVLVKRVRGRR
jgi:hypothetical protein